MLNLAVHINKIGWSEMPTGLFSPSTAGWEFFVYTKDSDVKIHISTKLFCSSSCGSLVWWSWPGPGAQCWDGHLHPVSSALQPGWADVGPAALGASHTMLELTAVGKGGLEAGQWTTI